MNKYPVNKEVCENCSSCHLVTETITGRHIPEEQQYYQCIADAVDLCVDGYMKSMIAEMYNKEDK